MRDKLFFFVKKKTPIGMVYAFLQTSVQSLSYMQYAIFTILKSRVKNQSENKPAMTIVLKTGSRTYIQYTLKHTRDRI